MHHVLFNSCKQLKHLTLYHCDTGSYSIFKIDAPDSKLCVPEIDKCRFLRVDLVCLPKLDKFFCDYWVSRYAPLTFGFVPSLGELELSSGSVCEEHIFKLSELLHGVTSIHTLTLDFQGETPYIIDGALSENSPYGGFEHSGIPDGIPQLEEYLAVHDLGLQQIGSCTLPFHYFEGHLSMQEYTTDGLWVMLQAVSILDLPARLAMLWLIVPGITLIEKMS
ncbi:uncharacterized protein LOC123425760 isoform X3 [Hordeum vulgare subsp. vulgare]|uniref:uncharacterized protein LOC123425760 isoform X3 n=1 Tax=Hordeum vulgare subsp. vulgare TaxID=112509 RepID=UPI001D1A353B|nr:uncharacterized protein LOC123425760 isoform X3 [Hordeum vulgare subsp. vulgare]XP_044965418.1 uncharacterized protein LOC123425760 isoform X3 [Hordeum vulgare subsp. vulgare]